MADALREPVITGAGKSDVKDKKEAFFDGRKLPLPYLFFSSLVYKYFAGWITESGRITWAPVERLVAAVF